MSTQVSINTLSEFLLQAQTQYIVIDMGRGLREIDNQLFFEWENQQAPCAYPRQEHAWFCVVFWNEQVNRERYIWFIKLPLDENGLMIQASRNQFLEIVVQALGENLQHTKDSQAQLPENPYVFVPSQQQLADCNALIRRKLNIDSTIPAQVQAYLQAPSLAENKQIWESFTLQNMADFVVHPAVANNNTQRQQIDQNQQAIANNIFEYPEPLLKCILSSLETIKISKGLSDALIKFHQKCDNLGLKSLTLRALSFCPDTNCKDYLAQLILAQATQSDDSQIISLDFESLVVIAGRYWTMLSDKELLQAFMQQVCELDKEFLLFKALYSDLVNVPSLREKMLAFIRNEQRGKLLDAAIGSLFKH